MPIQPLSILLLALAPMLASAALATPQALVAAARKQVGVTVQYDPRYERLAYPGGDVPLERGVCTDVVVRAYRQLGQDLQVLVHEDMRKAWQVYQQQGEENTEPSRHTQGILGPGRVPSVQCGQDRCKRHRHGLAATIGPGP